MVTVMVMATVTLRVVATMMVALSIRRQIRLSAVILGVVLLAATRAALMSLVRRSMNFSAATIICIGVVTRVRAAGMVRELAPGLAAATRMRSAATVAVMRVATPVILIRLLVALV